MSAQCRTSLAGAFANSASNSEISRIKSPKTRWRSAASEPNVISAMVLASVRDGLSKRSNNFVDIDGVFFAAQRAVLGIEVVDHVADQAVQAGPLVIRFRSIRHGQYSHTQIRSVSAAFRAALEPPRRVGNLGGPERTASLKYDLRLTAANHRPRPL
jgi:hypothetical protein